MNLSGYLKMPARLPVGKSLAVKDHAEIARKYCHILKKYGPHSCQVRHAALVMSTMGGDSDVLIMFDEILEAQDRVD